MKATNEGERRVAGSWRRRVEIEMAVVMMVVGFRRAEREDRGEMILLARGRGGGNARNNGGFAGEEIVRESSMTEGQRQKIRVGLGF